MTDYWTLGIIGLYTIINVIVFVIQRSEIKAVKGINESMRSFVDTFDVDEVKKFVKMKQKTMEMKYNLMIHDNEKLKDIATNVVMSKSKEMTEEITKQFKSEHFELIAFTVNVLRSMQPDKRQKVIDDNLPQTKRFISVILADDESNSV